MENLLSEAREQLYAGDLAEFMSERKRLAAEARAAGERAQAAAIGGLQKPTQPAWVLNQLSRRHRREVDLLLDAGHRLREAQGRLGTSKGRTEFEQARSRERDAIQKLTEQARQLLEREERKASAAVLVKVGETLRAVAASDEAREQLALGTFVKPLRPSGGFEVFEPGGIQSEATEEDAAPPNEEAKQAVKEARAALRAAIRERDARDREAQKAERETEKLQDALERAEQRSASAREAAEEAVEAVESAEAALRDAEERLEA